MRRLHTSHAVPFAYDGSDFAGICGPCALVRLKEPEVPFISNVSGTWITPEEATDPEYWVGHLRSAVRFADGLDELLSNPRASSSRRARAMRSARSYASISRLRGNGSSSICCGTLRKAHSDSAYLLHKIGRLGWPALISIGGLLCA